MSVSHNPHRYTEESAASPGSPRQSQKWTLVDAATALLAGAHDLTVTPSVLMDMVTETLTEDAVERFRQDWQKMNKL